MTTTTARREPTQGVQGPGTGAMFDGIARRYDLLNRLMSLGLDQGWRRRAVEALPKNSTRILDLATGTADVALEIVRQNPRAEVIGLDPSPEMLRIGETKIAERGLSRAIELRDGCAEKLPFEDDSFDGVTISFGIRNVPDRPAALAEMARVTRPDGRVVILELIEPESGLLAPLARFHVHHLVPRLGAWLSGAQEYRYLQSSIAAFPNPTAFAEMMTEAGLEVLTVRPMTLRACCLFVARPAEARPAEKGGAS